MDWIAAARAGNPRAVARLITQVENDAASAPGIVRALYADTGRAHVVGITGPPGSGKSSLVNELAKRFRQHDRRVGIVAVDPSSPFTGGALLGDRVRMRDLAGDTGIFVRSMASRGSLGGLARSTAAAVKVLDAAGYDLILIETVGAGQAEVDIATAAHTVVVLEAPGMGDDVQSIKAGILEIADILVVNKADRPGASRAAKSLEMMLHLGLETDTASDRAHHGADAAPSPADDGRLPAAGWATPVLQTVATTGEGMAALADAIERHAAHLTATGQRAIRDWERSRDEVEHLLRDLFMDQLRAAVPATERTRLIADVAERRLDPYSAAERLFASASDTFKRER
ncbi:methylmalonyl Co-A mutase-associated GTPase MeaB [Promineifilum sp.]|uniref:methylmalonyl Co-A mutase-associated GTPase MeaB n=1 Tax=Promineifilum sp. TaxID=2664178 RepID=UPI0035B32D8D